MERRPFVLRFANAIQDEIVSDLSGARRKHTNFALAVHRLAVTSAPLRSRGLAGAGYMSCIMSHRQEIVIGIDQGTTNTKAVAVEGPLARAFVGERAGSRGTRSFSLAPRRERLLCGSRPAQPDLPSPR